MERRMATPMYQSERQRDVFGLGLIVGACIGGASAAYVTLLACRLMWGA